MGKTLVYRKTSKNSLRRYPDRGTYNLREIHEIVNSTPVLHVSVNASDPEDPCPTIIPMIGVMGAYQHPSADLGDILECYLHGYVSNGLVKQARASDGHGVPLSISAPRVDGIVLSLTPNSHSYNYRSTVLFGYGMLVEDAEEKLWAMRLVTNRVLEGRWEEMRTPPERAEMASTAILRVKIVNGTGKIRSGGPNDEKKDAEREDITSKTFTGVLPVYEVIGDPVLGGAGKVLHEPQHVFEYRRRVNEENEQYARQAAMSKCSTSS